MKLDLVNLKNEKVGDIEVDPAVFGVEVKPHLHWEVVRSQLAQRRRGTASTKTRAEVKCSGRKPFKQKGTGRARQGHYAAPHMRGGGIVFGPKPREYSLKVPKKVRKAALRSALSLLVKMGRVKVVDTFALPEIKTKMVRHYLETLEVSKGLVVDVDNTNLKQSVRNLRSYKYLACEGVNVYDLLKFGGLVVTQDALRKVENRLAAGPVAAD